MLWKQLPSYHKALHWRYHAVAILCLALLQAAVDAILWLYPSHCIRCPKEPTGSLKKIRDPWSRHLASNRITKIYKIISIETKAIVFGGKWHSLFLDYDITYAYDTTSTNLKSFLSIRQNIMSAPHNSILKFTGQFDSHLFHWLKYF